MHTSFTPPERNLWPFTHMSFRRVSYQRENTSIFLLSHIRGNTKLQRKFGSESLFSDNTIIFLVQGPPGPGGAPVPRGLPRPGDAGVRRRGDGARRPRHHRPQHGPGPPWGFLSDSGLRAMTRSRPSCPFYQKHKRSPNSGVWLTFFPVLSRSR